MNIDIVKALDRVTEPRLISAVLAGTLAAILISASGVYHKLAPSPHSIESRVLIWSSIGLTVITSIVLLALYSTSREHLGKRHPLAAQWRWKSKYNNLDDTCIILDGLYAHAESGNKVRFLANNDHTTLDGSLEAQAEVIDKLIEWQFMFLRNEREIEGLVDSLVRATSDWSPKICQTWKSRLDIIDKRFPGRGGGLRAAVSQLEDFLRRENCYL